MEEASGRFFRNKTLMAVVLPGGIAGFVAWLMEEVPPDIAVFSEPVIGPILSIIFGAMAGLTVVVVLTNTDRSDTPRLVTLSFLAGLVWSSILTAGIATFSGDGSPFDSREEFELIGEVVDAAALITKDMTDDQRLAAEAELNRSVDAILRFANRTDFSDAIVRDLLKRVTQPFTPEVAAQDIVKEKLRAAGIEVDEILGGLNESFSQYTPSFIGDVTSDTAYVSTLDRLLPLFESAPETPDDIETLVLDTNLDQTLQTDTTTIWRRLEVPTTGYFRITLTDIDGGALDTIAAVYAEAGSELYRLMAEDDSALTFNPEFYIQLEVGQAYYLKIMQYGEHAAFSIRVAIVRE